MSAVTNTIRLAKQERKLRAIVHDLDQRLKLRGRELSVEHQTLIELSVAKLLGSDEAVDELSDVAINGGRDSSCDEDGFTADENLLARCCEAFYRLLDQSKKYEEARDDALVKVPIDKDGKRSKKPTPQETLDAVIAGERGRVRKLLKRRGTWREPKKAQRAGK